MPIAQLWHEEFYTYKHNAKTCRRIRRRDKCNVIRSAETTGEVWAIAQADPDWITDNASLHLCRDGVEPSYDHVSAYYGAIIIVKVIPSQVGAVWSQVVCNVFLGRTKLLDCVTTVTIARIGRKHWCLKVWLADSFQKEEIERVQSYIDKMFAELCGDQVFRSRMCPVACLRKSQNGGNAHLVPNPPAPAPKAAPNAKDDKHQDEDKDEDKDEDETLARLRITRRRLMLQNQVQTAPGTGKGQQQIICAQ